MSTPLSGKSVVVTRPREQAGDFVAMLREAGAEVTLMPAIRIEALDDAAILQAARALGTEKGATMAVFTSQNAVQHFLRDDDAVAALERVTVAAIGPATAEALRERGVAIDILARVHTADGLADAIEANDIEIRGRKVLFPCADIARDRVPARLEAMGASVERLPVYRTIPAPATDIALESAPDVLTFASPSAVTHFDGALDDAIAGACKQHSLAACIGPTTADAARELGYQNVLTAAVHTAPGLRDAIIAHYAKGVTR